MTRSPDDLMTVLHADEGDVCTADELLARVARTVGPTRRRRTRVAVVAVIVVLTAVATIYAQRPDRRSGTHPVRPTRIDERTRVVDLGQAQVRVPRRWFAAPYRGQPATVYFPTLFLATTPFTGPCGSTGQLRRNACTTANWFPPHSVTPRDGVILKWGESEFPAGTDRLTFAPGSTLVIDGRPAKLYTGSVIDGSCPDGARTEVAGAVRVSTARFAGGHLVDVVACLGPDVSATDRRAVYDMISSLRMKPS